MKLSPALYRLCDPSERSYVIDLIHREWLKFPEDYTPVIQAQTIKENIVAPLEQFLSEKIIPRLKHDLEERIIHPLEQFLEDEWNNGKFVEGHEGWGKVNMETGGLDKGPWIEGRWVGSETTATEAARKFRTAANDIVYRYENLDPVDSEMWLPYLGIMDECWKEFQVQMCWGGLYEAEQRTKDSKKGADRVNHPKTEKANREHEKIRCFACEIKGEATISKVTTRLSGSRKTMDLCFKTMSIEHIIKELRKDKYGVTLKNTALREALKPITHPAQAKSAPHKPTTQK